MPRIAILGYGLAAYLFFVVTFLRAVGFVTALGPEPGLDRAAPGAGLAAWAIDLGLLTLFALQHMIMARRGFKERITAFIPPAIERSTFVVATCVALNLLVGCWRALPGVVWRVEGEAATALTGLSLAGFGIVLVTTFLIDHFELFGLAQVWRAFRGSEPGPKRFVTPSVYRLSRHPMYLGFFIAFWATPVMTAGHLLFAAMTTAWVVFEVVVFEEPALVDDFGERYRDYQRRVRMFLPIPREPARRSRIGSPTT